MRRMKRGQVLEGVLLAFAVLMFIAIALFFYERGRDDGRKGLGASYSQELRIKAAQDYYPR